MGTPFVSAVPAVESTGSPIIPVMNSAVAEMITAIYEKGVLRPLEPLHLRESQRVRIQIETEESSEEHAVQEARERVVRILVEAGLMQPEPTEAIPPDPLSVAEREALAERLGRASGKLASEMVIEDRGEW